MHGKNVNRRSRIRGGGEKEKTTIRDIKYSTSATCEMLIIYQWTYQLNEFPWVSHEILEGFKMMRNYLIQGGECSSDIARE